MPGRRRRTTTSRRRTASTTTTKARTRTATRAPARPKAAAPELPVAGPGERVWVLAVPFRAPAPGATWHAGLAAHVYVGPARALARGSVRARVRRPVAARRAGALRPAAVLVRAVRRGPAQRRAPPAAG